jgi:putative ABC transport system substrate-binding protein
MGDAEVDRERPVETVWRSVSYVDRILKGVNPSELPAQQPSKFESAINLKTAKRPDRANTLLAAADGVIE